MSVAFKLYELSDHIARVQAMLENGEEGLEDTLESLEISFDEKAESIIKLWRSKIAERDIIKSEVYRLSERMNKIDREAQWLLNYVEQQMKLLDRERIPSTLFKIALQNNPQSVNITDEQSIPAEYWRIVPEKREPDKRTMLDVLKSGQAIPGAEIKQERSLKIR